MRLCLKLLNTLLEVGDFLLAVGKLLLPLAGKLGLLVFGRGDLVALSNKRITLGRRSVWLPCVALGIAAVWPGPLRRVVRLIRHLRSSAVREQLLLL